MVIFKNNNIIKATNIVTGEKIESKTLNLFSKSNFTINKKSTSTTFSTYSGNKVVKPSKRITKFREI